MIVKTFSQNCKEYENFAIWDIEDMDAFFGGSDVLAEIFENDYKMPAAEYKAKREEILDTDIEVMTKLLDQVGDKHFYVFTLHDNNHMELIQLQETKVMNFGMNIQEINGDRVYTVMMDKKELKLNSPR